MQVGIADARRRLKEILDRVAAGGIVEITRRGEIVAVVAPPSTSTASEPWGRTVEAWRATWRVAEWADDDPFGALRDREAGREPPW